MRLSIIVPVYNEEKTILEILRRVQAVDFGMEKEIIVVDDGSTDGTTDILRTRTDADGTRTNADTQPTQTDADGTRTDADGTQTDAENKLLYEKLSYKIRSAAFSVRRKVGLGHKEKIYQNALEEEFKSLELSYEKEKIIDIFYNNKKIGVYRPDFIIKNKIILEIKALPYIGKNERQQIWTYLKGSNYKLLLLINFSPKDVQFERLVYDTARLVPCESASPPGGSVLGPRLSASSLRNFALKVIFQEKNCGKGAALRRGFQEATGDIIAVQDADLEYHPQELPSLLAPILQGQSRIVYGARFLRPHQPRYKLFYKGNCLISWLFGAIYGVRINDPWTGYKVFRREVLAPLHLTSQGFDLEIELTAKWLKAKEKILELPISYQGRTYQEGKKIKWTDGIRALWAIIKYRL